MQQFQKSIIDGDPFAGSIALTGQPLKFITEEFKLFVKHLNQINEEQKNEIKRLKEENMSFKKKQQVKIQHTDQIKLLGDDEISNLEKVEEIGSGGGGRTIK